MNNCSFIGRVGKDAAVRQGKTAATGFSVAVDVGFGENKQTLWLDCTMWGERGERVAPHILKGDSIGVQGEIGTREYDGKTYVTLRVSDVTLLGQKKDAQRQAAPAGNGSTAKAPATNQAQTDAAFDDDDIPF